MLPEAEQEAEHTIVAAKENCVSKMKSADEKACSKCGQPYKGWGDVCGGCRKLKRAVTAKACSNCGIFFAGSADTCDECGKAEDIRSRDDAPTGEDSLAQQADATEQVAELLCPANIEEDVTKENVFGLNSHTEKGDDGQGEDSLAQKADDTEKVAELLGPRNIEEEVNSHSRKADDVAAKRLVEPQKPELGEHLAPSTEDPDRAGQDASSAMTEVSRKHELKHVTIQKLNGKRGGIKFQKDASTESVAALKNEVRFHLAIPRIKQISLVLDDALLQDEMTLVDSGVVDGSVLNLVVAKRPFLEALQEEASDWTWDGRPNCSADLVSAVGGGYSLSTVQHLLKEISWLSNVLDEKAVEKIGKVWYTGSSRKIASPNFRTNREHTHTFFFEFEGCTYRVSRVTTDFSFSIRAHCDSDDDDPRRR